MLMLVRKVLDFILDKDVLLIGGSTAWISTSAQAINMFLQILLTILLIILASYRLFILYDQRNSDDKDLNLDKDPKINE